MAEDLYSVLEVPRNATQDEIQKSYRRLARKHHPDLHGDSDDAKKKFQRIQQAYDVLGDEEKRKQYDRLGPDFERMKNASGGSPFGGADFDFSQIFGQGGPGGPQAGGGGLEDLLRTFGMGGQRAGRGQGPAGPKAQPAPAPSLDLDQQITIPFGVAVSGGEHRLSIQQGSNASKTLSVRIPPGIEAGKKIRLRGQGRVGPDLSQGDLYVVVHIAPHPHFRRIGNNLLVKIPVTVREAVFGTTVELPTPHGTISLKVPGGSSSGRVLRAKGMGVRPENQPPGDLLAEVEILVPTDLAADELERLSSPLAGLDIENPRAELSW